MLPQVPRLQQHTHVPNTQTHARAVVRHLASRAKRTSMCRTVMFSHSDSARDCLSRCIHLNTSTHTSPAYGTCRAKRTAYLAADEMLTRKKQHLDRVCVANLVDHRVTLRSGWLSAIRYCIEHLHKTRARMPRSTFQHHCLAFTPVSNSSRYHKEFRQFRDPGFT